MSLIPSDPKSVTPYHSMTLRCSVSATGRLEYSGLPAIATGSPRSLVVPRSSLQVSRTEGPSGIRSGERGSLRRVGVVLFEPVPKAARGYLTLWLGRSEGVTFIGAYVGTGER
jgi:hypothetical protein